MRTIPYRPSLGIEGHIFMDCFCHRCKRDAKFQETMAAEDGCPIIANALVYDIEHPNYPKEWVQDEDAPVGLIGDNGARCTAFEPEEGEVVNEFGIPV